MVQRKSSVAIIGSGLAGLTAAHLLSSSRIRKAGLDIDVHLFEKSATLGMDSHSISIMTEGHEEHRIDVPMRSFQGGYYQQLIGLYRRLGVEFRCADFSYSFSTLKEGTKNFRDLRTYFIYNGSSGVKGISLPSNNPSGQSPQNLTHRIISFVSFALLALTILFNYIRLAFLSSPFLRPKRSVTFREWHSRTTPKGILARSMRYDACWNNFVHKILLPMFSAVCTAPEEDIWAHPAAEILEYVWLTLGTHHYVVQNGVRDVVSRLSRHIQHIHLSSSIVSIDIDPSDKSRLSIQTTTQTYSGFSHLIIATQANSGLPLLSSYYSSLSEDSTIHRKAVADLIDCLKAFQYRKTIVINHTDRTFIAADNRDHRDLNLVSWFGNDADERQKRDGENEMVLPASYTMATHVLRRSPTGPMIYQTTNPTVSPCPGSILSIAVLERAIVTVESKNALEGLSVREEGWWPFIAPSSSLGPLQGAGRLRSSTRPGIWVCGSFASHGIPLLEGCVTSARDVIEQGILRSEGITSQGAPW